MLRLRPVDKLYVIRKAAPRKGTGLVQLELHVDRGQGVGDRQEQAGGS